MDGTLDSHGSILPSRNGGIEQPDHVVAYNATGEQGLIRDVLIANAVSQACERVCWEELTRPLDTAQAQL